MQYYNFESRNTLKYDLQIGVCLVTLELVISVQITVGMWEIHATN